MLVDTQRTFRDPAGSVSVTAEGVFRSVYPAYQEHLFAFLKSPVASRLVAAGHMVDTEVVGCDDAGALLSHPRVSFISYPWEWPPALWLAAAEHTLFVCEELIRAGWILKDATPLNVLFRGTAPVFVDVLSVQPLDGSSSMWLAYAQFVRTFLLPMLGYAELGWSLQATQTRRDGIEPEELFSTLRWGQRWSAPARTTVTLPTLLARSKALKKAAPTASACRNPDIAKRVLLNTIRSLRKSMRQATPAPKLSAWSQYREQARHYEQADHSMKREFVSQVLAERRPRAVLDVGCNSGVYSNLAADAGAEVISIDTDIMALERLCAEVVTSKRNILPLCVDLSRPTPATGWRNAESQSFLERCQGRFDTVFMLAVLHHLLVTSQIPMDHIAELISETLTDSLIVEWVPLGDPKFQELLRGREAIYSHITEASFREAFSLYFRVAQEQPLGNGRILFHMVKPG